ncbi:MAG: protein-glutamate O-methyltransferase CheR, partial [Desulfobulbaceae bacterium]|nr:protein-glutamate O-methyltransferase CheR [Desulfobulbaceae bacterium]
MISSITSEEIQVLSKYIFEISGIQLSLDKGYLLETRLKPLLKFHGCATYSELYYQAKIDPSKKLKKEIIEAITTNETFFFRDNTPFELLRNKIIPDLIDRRTGVSRSGRVPVRIWSAACSTGQEVYSIAMTLMEMLPDLGKYDIFILGTDISDKVVANASYGKYNKFEVERGLPTH